jgi:hypothetical protein
MKKGGKKGGVESDSLGAPSNPKLGRTMFVKGHPSHPGMDFVSARGGSKGTKPVKDEKMVPQHTKRKPKTGQK